MACSAGAAGEGSPATAVACGDVAGMEACEARGGRAASSSRSPPTGCDGLGEACGDDDNSTCVGSDWVDVGRLSLQDAVAVDEGGAGSCPRTPWSVQADTPEVGASSGVDRGMLVAALSSVLVYMSRQGCRPHVDMGFNSLSVPQITVHAYLQRISDYFDCSDECLLAGLMYIDRVVKMRRAFVVSPLSVHRVVLASIVLAAKFWDDHYYSNRHYAKVGLVMLQEMNFLELRLLKLLQFRLTISPEEFQNYQSTICDVVRGLSAAQRSV